MKKILSFLTLLVAFALAAPALAADAPVAKLYFDSGKTDLPGDAAKAIAPVVDAAKAAKSKVKVSGYHDKTGDPAANAELAKNRAKIVLDVLTAAGVPGDRVMLQKPQQMDGGDGREARRVEVSPAQ